MSATQLYPYEVDGPGYIDLTAMPMPALGGKVWVLDRKGQFVLEKGPGTFRTTACTHAGSGNLLILDGVPEENGEFRWDLIEKPNYFGNGKLLFKANPVVMGSWMLDAGFNHGLTVRHLGGQFGTPAMASLVWVPYKAKVK